MKKRSTEKSPRKAYTSPKLVVYGKVSDLTHGGPGGRGRRRGKIKSLRGGGGRGHGGSRS